MREERHASKLPGIGVVTGDVAWGGNWFFLVDDHGDDLTLANVERLTDFAWRIRQALEAEGITGADGARDRSRRTVRPAGRPGEPQPELRALPRQGLRPLALRHRHQRRSSPASRPTARLKRRRNLAAGEHRRQRVRGVLSPGGWVGRPCHSSGDSAIRGTAYVTGEATLLLDPRDPFVRGIRP